MNTATFHIDAQDYVCPVIKAELSAYFGLDPHWRELDYANGGSALCLGVQIAFDPSGSHGLIDPFDRNRDTLSLEIINTKWDQKTEQCVTFGNLPLHFDLHDLAQTDLSKDICAASTLWLPSMPKIADISSISFGALTGTQMRLLVNASVEYGQTVHDTASDTYQTTVKEMGFTLDTNVSIGAITINVRGNQMATKDIDNNVAESRACFATLLCAEAYESEVIIRDAKWGDLDVVFTAKR